MRELTQKEIDNAPDWATHYKINTSEVHYESSEVHYESPNKWMAIGTSFPFIVRGPFSQKSKLTKCKPIPRKPFDIGEYEFDDCEIEAVECCNAPENEYIRFNFIRETGEAILSKQDAVAIAKHFKLI